MPLDPPNLVGICCCQGGGWNGYALIFRPDDIGRSETSSGVLANAWVFDWRLEGNELVVDGRQSIELNEPQDGVDHLPWDFHAQIRVTLGSVGLDNGEVRRTLNLASPLTGLPAVGVHGGQSDVRRLRRARLQLDGRLGRGN